MYLNVFEGMFMVGLEVYGWIGCVYGWIYQQDSPQKAAYIPWRLTSPSSGHRDKIPPEDGQLDLEEMEHDMSAPAGLMRALCDRGRWYLDSNHWRMQYGGFLKEGYPQIIRFIMFL